MMMTLDQLLQLVGEHAHRILIKDNEKDLVPLYHLITRENESFVISCPWADEEQKLLSLEAIKRIAAEKDAVLVAFVSEVWMTKQDAPLTSWHAQNQEYTPPSQDPNRIEAVLAIASDGVNTKAKMWQMVRSRPGGMLIALVPEHFSDEGKLSGRMIDGIIPRSVK